MAKNIFRLCLFLLWGICTIASLVYLKTNTYNLMLLFKSCFFNFLFLIIIIFIDKYIVSRYPE